MQPTEMLIFLRKFWVFRNPEPRVGGGYFRLKAQNSYITETQDFLR